MTQYSDFDLLHNISPGKHFYQFYKSTEDYLKVMVSFFQAGLEKGQACLWLVSETKGLDEVRLFAGNTIPHFSRYRVSGQMSIQSAEKWYREAGRFDMRKTQSAFDQYLRKVLKNGYPVLRLSGDAAAFMDIDHQVIQAYEERSGRAVASLPVIALCAYPILDCTITATKVIIDSHDDVLVGRL